VVKIDRSFIAQIDTSHEAAAVVEGVALLSRRLNIEAVAEGIETPEQANAVRAMGITQGQGFLYARPSAPAAVSQLLRLRHRPDGISTQVAVAARGSRVGASSATR
jgi:EAL domain-containing protein (putative c-di-GMP-specific phosphodiesterase class I)